MTMHRVLERETAHLSQVERDLIEQRLVVAIELARHFPRACERALTDKLQSLGGCPRWTCTLIARAAREVMPGEPVAVAQAA